MKIISQLWLWQTNHPKFHGIAKHVEIKYHFIREQVENKTVILKYCRTEEMVADIITKGLTQFNFNKLRDMIGVKPMN